jgi:hypothetical protein
MSDIRCIVCGEPWDAYGVSHGDMLPWETRLFRAGAGCPACKGTPNGYTPKTIFDVANGDGDEMDRIVAAERVAEGTAPRWIRPEDPIHWTCDGCGVEVVTDLDSGDLQYHVPFKSRARSWYSSHSFYGMTPEVTPAHVFTSGQKVCEACLSHCDECSTPLCQHLDLETYDEGCSFPSPQNPYRDNDVCIDCLGVVEDRYAQETWRSCYNDAERIEYIRDHRDQFEFRTFADMLGCARGRYFAGYASELIN